jgi:hypothetical protein
MEKHETDWYPGIVSDGYAHMRKVRAEIREETKHMTPAERMEHTRHASEEFREEIRQRRAELAKAASADN